MGNDEVGLEDIQFDLPKTGVGADYDMHGYNVWDQIEAVEKDLKESELRGKHPELQAAWDNYQAILEKYKFWKQLSE